ncbi:asparagine synthase (glutamine-hydrolyzing) [Ferrovibrio sp.]|uniref:asparagine synthase (glutamine-hydrolyzing) n=1 Tax=Ferrovibrio sp. TaxID=1917215 RepID=UPI0026297A0C|nr:asparagine synthase (glutamine-hydrolyzing) [Ferrovibrio sp.]
MCGFAALFERDRDFPQDLLQAIGQDLRHRGPDSEGIVDRTGMALVFRRLSILDIRHIADQPMTDDSGRYTLVYNGEIYNYRALRSELETAGHQFKTNGDTEVLLHGFMQWGEGVLGKAEGMFAFVIVDHATGKVTAARDALGIKPLYISRQGNLIALSSEMRPLQRLVRSGPCRIALAELLVYRFAAGRLSNLENIDRIPPGTVVTFNLDGSGYAERRYFDITDSIGHTNRITPQAAADMVRESVESSVAAHLASDVDYAVQLSGGIDSSLVTVLAAKGRTRPLHSFAIGFPDSPHDESAYRREVIETAGTVHHEMPVDSVMFADALPRAVSHMEGPSPHLGCILLMLLCDRIRDTTKVVLTGEGADEAFGGYERYAQWQSLQRYRRLAQLVPERLWPLLKRYGWLKHYSDHDPAIFSSVFSDYWKLPELFPSLAPAAGAREEIAARFPDFRDRMMAVDQTVYLESLLLRQDKMAMAASVEARVPFAHAPLFQAMNSIPHHLRVPGGRTKPLLKGLAEKFFSSSFVHRRKVALTIPLAEWLAVPTGLGRYLELLTEPNARLPGYGDRVAIRRMVDSFRGGDRSVARILVHMINIETWLRSVANPVTGASR